MLGRQAEQVIDSYGFKRLNLAPAVLRIVAEFLILDTDNLTWARRLLDEADISAQRSEDDLERLHIYRLRGQAAAREAAVGSLISHFEKAVTIALEYDRLSSRRAIQVESLSRTYALAFFSALLAADRRGGL